MSKSVVIATTSKTDLGPAPVSTDWVHNGKPDMRSKEVARSHDHTSHVMIWDCTGGRFTWNYEKDETFVVLSGEAFITNEKDEERRISPGDIVFFPAGTSSRWHVPSYIKKVAFLRHTMPRPRIWRTCLELIRPESQILGAPNLDRVPIGEEAQDAPGPHIGRY